VSRMIAVNGVYGRRHASELRRREMRSALLKQSGSALPGLLSVASDIVKSYEGDLHEIDLAVFDLGAGKWWAGRIVPLIDDLEADVLLPTLGLRRTQYLVEDAESVAEAAPVDARDTILRLVLSQVPEVVTFTSNPLPRWYEKVASFEGHLAVLEAFSSTDGSTLLRINGDIPRARGQLMAPCLRVPGAAAVVKIPGRGDAWPDGTKTFEYMGESLRVISDVVGPDVLLRLEGKILAGGQDLAVWQIASTHFEIRGGDAPK
jgi:hypothetical protein